MLSVIKRGLLAGAAGTTALNAVTYLDMALTGRSPSETPEQSIDRLMRAIGRDLPGTERERDNRRSAFGALAGIASGLAIGVAANTLRNLGVRLPGVLGAVGTGALAMAATNVPMAFTGISDPRQWSAAEWASDVLPHLAYGWATHAVLAA